MRSKVHAMNQMIIAQQRTQEKQFWEQKLSGDIGITGFPYDASLSAAEAGQAGTSADFKLPEPLSALVLKVGSHSDYAIHVILLSGLAALLQKYTGTADAVIGSPIYTQETQDAEFINTMLPLRVELDGG
ncbi:condensation domain-containing protein, partial [Paenibacillus elgii]